MGVRLHLRGCVQGVGFRPWVRRLTRELGVRGHVANTADGVVIEAFGEPDALATLQGRLKTPPLPGASVDAIEAEDCERSPEPTGFDIARSTAPDERAGHELALAPDLPTCPECLAELGDAHGRRYRHAFIACAHCGPRYTIARALPWDRERTAMHDLPLCAACAREYDSPDDRRHHAEATSCPACGPTLRLVRLEDGRSGAAPDEGATGDAALEAAAAILRDGGVVAVQGIGGFHLACRALDEPAVRRLRARKRRPTRPLAAIVASVEEAEKLALVDEAERALLASEARPIVLLRRRPDAGLAANVAPGFTRVGLMLAYAPVHVLLLAAVGEPLVMTSANRSGEPMVHRAEAARAALAGVADALLVHDREIVTPCDDSVAVVAPSGPVLMRRARGYVPRPIRLARPVERAVLALGGQWSNTICIAAGGSAWVSEHVGDLESPASLDRLEETLERWQARLGVEPEVVAHDLHPGYETTRLAQRWPAERRRAVQHHHAHLAAVLGEHDPDGPALGLIWDGTGAGPDGAAWGGELLLGDASGFERLATFRPIALAGGERAIREPWRVARAWLRDAFEGAAPPTVPGGLFDAVPAHARDAVDQLLERPELCVPAHGVGRLFDAVAALVLRRPTASFSGELAQAFGDLATGRPAAPYPFRIDESDPTWQIDLRPAARALVHDLQGGHASPARIADRFHATLAAVGETIVREALGSHPPGTYARPRLVLGGGCFQNPVLVSTLESRLGRELEVLRPRLLPPGDGGLAFGQACVAGWAGGAPARGTGADPIAHPSHEEEA